MVEGGARYALSVFELSYSADAVGEVRVPLAEAWSLRLESLRPVRRFRSYRGQRHLSGQWWSATTGRHVGFESWLERDQLVALDFDPAVVGIASQPFWLFWSAEEPAPRPRSHAPDYFVRKVDGTGVVIDCRPVDRRGPRDLAAFESTRRACELVGWEYRLLGAPDPIVTANLRWLSGYRHPRHRISEIAERLRAAFADPLTLMDGATAVGDRIAVLPVLFHLIWQHELNADLSLPLRGETIVTAMR